jgi:formate dehydrogenase major subunit
VFLGIGAQGSRGLGCPGEEFAVSAVDFLGRAAEGRAPAVAGRVLVLGGGNSAMDAARTALRLGAADVTVLYRRTRREMPCLMAEVDAAEAEGVRLEALVAPVRLERIDAETLRLTCVRMTLGPPDASGRARPEPVPGSEFALESGTVISAIGQTVETSAFEGSGLAFSLQGIAADATTLATNLDGVFAGGDGVTGADVAVRAVAAGRLAAISIDQYLGGRRVEGHPEMLNVLMGTLSESELAELFRQIEQAPRAHPADRPPAERARSFDEVEPGLTLEAALQEGRRCMRCGCWKSATCRLRQYGTEYGADPLRFAGERRPFHRDASHPEIVYEPGKCVLCGACVTVAAEAGEPVGLTFVGRGFGATVGVPLGHDLPQALACAAERAAQVCPTGAFALGASTTHPLEFRRPLPR